MISIATKSDVSELARHLSDCIPKLAGQVKDARTWTDAVYKAFAKYSGDRPRWTIYPDTKAKKGEYLCDFMLFEEGYGPRIACESQWEHDPRLGDHRVKLAWSFDKLRGVKADVKVFIFEGQDQQWETIWREYLTGYTLLSPDEAFLILKFEDYLFRASWWKPSRPGVHREDEITFDPIDIAGAL